MKGLSLEARVGLLILTAAVLLGAFLFVLGGVSFEDEYTVHVDFDNPGSVQTGAAVRVGGVKVGSVEQVTYLGRRLDPQTGRQPLVRMRLSIFTRVRETLHEDALFYVTSQGVLGEQFVAVDPGSPDRPLLAEGAFVQGVDPPRLDLALALGYELLETLVQGVRNNRDELGTLLDDIVTLIRTLRVLLTEHEDDVGQIVANARTLSEESVSTLRAAREAYVDGEEPRRIVRTLDRTLSTADRTLSTVDRAAPDLLREVNRAVQQANELMETVGPEQREQIRTTLASAERVATRADATMTEAQQIVRHVRQGRGTVGSLLMDEEIYDDLQELIRDLKHNPWKFFWRE